LSLLLLYLCADCASPPHGADRHGAMPAGEAEKGQPSLPSVLPANASDAAGDRANALTPPQVDALYHALSALDVASQAAGIP
jgi:hypothetical protein